VLVLVLVVELGLVGLLGLQLLLLPLLPLLPCMLQHAAIASPSRRTDRLTLGLGPLLELHHEKLYQMGVSHCT